MSVNFSMLDWAVVGLYFLIIAGIAVWVALQKERNTSDYFLASRDATWFLIGASIFCSRKPRPDPSTTATSGRRASSRERTRLAALSTCCTGSSDPLVTPASRLYKRR